MAAGNILKKANPTVVIVVVGVILVLVIVLVMILSNRAKSISKYKINQLDAATGGEIPEGWNPTATTDSLYQVIDAYFTTSEMQVAGKFNSLNDNQKIEVYNDWADRYFEEDDETLTRAVKNEFWTVSFSGPNQWDLMESNLDRLDLP